MALPIPVTTHCVQLEAPTALKLSRPTSLRAFSAALTAACVTLLGTCTPPAVRASRKRPQGLIAAEACCPTVPRKSLPDG